MLGLRDRDRGGSTGSSVTASAANGNVEPLPPVLPPPQRSLLDRNDYRNDRNDRNERSERERDDRYDRRPFGREFEKDRMGGGSGNSRGSHQNSRYSSNMQSGGGGNDRRRMYNENSGRTIEEPEWFSGGPTSQHDTIELRGFDEPEPDEKPPPPTPPADKTNDPETKLNNNTNISNNTKNSNQSRSDVVGIATASSATSEDNVDVDDNNSTKATASLSSPPARSTPTKLNESNSKSDRNKNHRNDQSGDDDFNFEDFLKMDSISDLLTVCTNFLMNFTLNLIFLIHRTMMTSPRTHRAQENQDSVDGSKEKVQIGWIVRVDALQHTLKITLPLSPTHRCRGINSLRLFHRLTQVRTIPIH